MQYFYVAQATNLQLRNSFVFKLALTHQGTTSPPTMESSGKPSHLTLPPFSRPGLGLASSRVLPALRSVIPFQEKQTPSVLLAIHPMARLPVVEKPPVSSDTQDVRMEDIPSSKRLLPAGAMPQKKRTPLPNSRPSGALLIPHEASSKHPSNGRKRPSATCSSDGEDDADSDIRGSKRSCQGHPTPVNDVDWNLDESKDIKPPVSYVQMAKTAILGAPEAVLSLDGILAFITANYAYYRLLHDNNTWKKSVYNGLRSCKAFEKVGKSTMIYSQRWQVKAEYRAVNMPVRKPARVPFPGPVRSSIHMEQPASLDDKALV